MRKDDLIEVVKLIGAEHARLVDPADGWPALLDVQLPSGPRRIAFHGGVIKGSGRGRDDERRFQNPGQDRPVIQPAGSLAVLAGWWQPVGEVALDRPVMVLFDAARRIGLATRQSFFMPLWLLERAAVTGWAEHISTSGERIVAIRPELFLAWVLATVSGVSLEPAQLDVIEEAFAEEGIPTSVEARARATALRLVRDARFGRTVTDAYEGVCGLCGLGHGLVEGAHILPVSAPGSEDEVWNAICLCRNHHAAFDRHLLWIEPRAFQVRLHPDLLNSASAGSARFRDSTARALVAPARAIHRPKPEMFERRYGHFGGAYDWVSTR